jgi:SRSO17 transposase
VPEEVTFATEGELARKMLERAFDASVPAAWVTGGEIYGTDKKLRRWLETRGRSYVLAQGRSSTLPRGRHLAATGLGMGTVRLCGRSRARL